MLVPFLLAPHSHNLFLDVAVEQGLPALLALVWGWSLLVFIAWQGVVRGRGGLLGAAALSLILTLVHAPVDNVFYGSRALLLLFAPLALVALMRIGFRYLGWIGGRA